MPWYTLVRGPDDRPVPHAITDKERTEVRAIDGATLYESEAHALLSLQEHHTPLKPGSRFTPWKQSVRLLVVPRSEADERIARKRRGEAWSDR